MIELTGVSWDHPRGHGPMVATAAAYMAEHPGVRITWTTRSLQDFADFPIEVLAQSHDLILIDHPFTGFASVDGCLLPLDQYLESDFLDHQALNSVGPSHGSYGYGGHQWALAVDAASQVSSFRADLLEEIGQPPPTTWDEVLRLARRRKGQARGQVAIPLIPVDTLMSFLSICASLGEEPFATPDVAIGRSVGRAALELVIALRQTSHPESIAWNPIRAYDRMSQTDEIAYVPLAFGYVNYSLEGFRPHRVTFTNIPHNAQGLPAGGILGGVGLAVSSRCAHPEVAVDYARFVADGATQRGMYFSAGGQPGHRSAWLDDTVNETSHGFFRDTLETLDHAYLRPRYLGFMALQERAWEMLHDAVVNERDIDSTLDTLDALYRASLSNPPSDTGSPEVATAGS